VFVPSPHVQAGETADRRYLRHGIGRGGTFGWLMEEPHTVGGDGWLCNAHDSDMMVWFLWTVLGNCSVAVTA
jgi:hypothetical protein